MRTIAETSASLSSRKSTWQWRSAGGCAAGSTMRKVVPVPGSLCTSIAPSCACTMPCTTARPRPVPSPTDFVLKKGSNMRSRIRGSIPVPESDTVKRVHVCGLWRDPGQLDGDAAGAALHGLPRVRAQIDQELVDLRGVGKDRRCPGIAFDNQLGPGRQRDTQQPGGVLHDLVQRQPTPLRRLRTRKRKNPLNDLGGAPAGLVDLLDALPRRMLRADVHARELDVGENGAKGVVELVRYAGRKRAHGLHFLRLPQLFLEDPALLVRLPALQELPDLAPDHRDRLQQLRFRFACLAACEVKHADRPSVRGDREHEGAMEADLAQPDFGRALGGARIVAHVGRPRRLARLPGEARQADPGPVDDLAGQRDKALERRVQHAPAIGKAQHAGWLVHAKIAAAIPAFRLANGPDDLLQRRRRAVRLSQDAGHGVLELAQLFGAPALGDVARDSAIALEDPRRIEYRLAAHPHPDLAARGIEAAQLQVAKRLARLEQRAVRRPVRFAQVDVLELPALLAQKLFCTSRLDFPRRGVPERPESKLLVLLPVPVGGELGQAAKPLFALVQVAQVLVLRVRHRTLG